MSIVKYFFNSCCGILLSIILIGCTSTKPPQNKYIEQHLVIDNGDYKIPGILVTPKITSGKKLPVVVLLHGTASQKNEVGNLYQRLAIYLAEKGYASLRIDFAGTGDSPVDYKLYNLTSAQRDTSSAINYLVNDKQFDGNRIGLISFSQGGLIAQLVAAKDPQIKSLITWSSVGGNGIDIFKTFFDEYYAEAQRNGFAVVKFPWRPTPLNFSLPWFTEIKNNTSLDDIKNFKGKLLAIAGSADTIVPSESSNEIIKAAGSSDATLIVIKGADHMYNVLGDSNANGLADDQRTAENMLAITTEWIARKL